MARIPNNCNMHVALSWNLVYVHQTPNSKIIWIRHLKKLDDNEIEFAVDIEHCIEKDYLVVCYLHQREARSRRGSESRRDIASLKEVEQQVDFKKRGQE